MNISHQARLSYLALSSIRRSFSTTYPPASPSHFHRSDFTGQPFTGSYEPGLPTSGPLGDASVFGVPRLTPRALKQHLDQFVVGQERAKKVLSVAVYNHYQRIQELKRRDEEEEELLQQRARREMADRHPVEGNKTSEKLRVYDLEPYIGGGHLGEYPGQKSTNATQAEPRLGASSIIIDRTPLTIEKSNIMMLGPSGVGKTLMAKTLARILEVPFSMSDCTPFTQAGYIGEDAEVCVQRLLAASNWDVARAERGIICLDEVDKIATAKVSHGKDVSGEGVQQALLKIIEGTTLHISAKQERGVGGRSPGGSPPGSTGGPSGYPGGGATSSPMGTGGLGSGTVGGSNGAGGSGGGKGEVYTVRTDNILFIFTGAFIGLHKIILDRVSKGSIGFGAPIRSGSSSSQATIKGDEAVELFKKYLPFFTPTDPDTENGQHNALDLVEPADLQKYGLIPELIGRIPVSTALSALDEEALVRVLTEPRNCLLKQYEQLFALSGIELRFTSGALREVAKTAVGMETGARGLRTVMERLLGDAMFEAPGSSVKHVLVTENVARRKEPVIYFSRGQQGRFYGCIAKEEEEWERRRKNEDTDTGDAQSFEEHREKVKAVGVV
ncbi:hypothetical protein FGG08_003005 [Glutinoglossum americanum]|uniref:ATP-dependent Clp protease ATP-binding subunit ClpX n=1 Tax=Glutinoglossum americanum TaxID=1670608 RepID=A0A9P8I856_9PEZI|nr:hypothetical protein FGG08_003005 [Glutinoglossum americanum]